MKISHSALPRIRLSVLIAFMLLCAVIFGFLWVNSGGRLPLVTRDGYRVGLTVPKASNLVQDSDVMIAGVRVGKVAGIRPAAGGAQVTMQLDKNAPLHRGASVQVREKTLINETYLEIADGHGPPLASGSRLPPGAGKPPVELDDVLRTLDPPTRHALASSVRSLGMATADNRASVDRTLTGLGDLGRNGHDAVAALNAQSGDLRQLTANTTTLLVALNSRQGQIADLVDNTNRLAAVTDSNSAQIEHVVRDLPGVLDSAQEATTSLRPLSGALQPVAADLRTAAPGLSQAAGELPQTSAALRGLLPALDSAVGKANPTLTRVPPVAADASGLVPPLQADLNHLNPMLTYLEPYGQDVAHMLVNWGASMNGGNTEGKALRLLPVLSPQSVTGNPVDLNVGPLKRRNPYTAPGQANDPGAWQGTYPRVEEEHPPR